MKIVTTFKQNYRPKPGMIRNSKHLGVAAVAIFAISAIMASTALAVPQFTASSYPSTLTGSSGAGTQVFTTEAGKIECGGHFEGTTNEAGPTLYLTFKLTNCKAFGFLEASVNSWECHWLFHLSLRVSLSPVTFTATPDFDCTSKSMEVTAATCKMTVGSQNGIPHVHFTPIINRLRLKFTLTGLSYTVTQDGFGCPFNGTGAKTGAEYSGEVDIERVGGGSITASGE